MAKMPRMKDRRQLITFVVVASCFFLPSALEAKRDVADYTLRLRILGSNWHHDRDGYHANGRGDLFDEQGTPHGVDFTYDCGDHLMASMGNESYPAKWKKPGQSVEVIFGQIGDKPNSLHACDVKLSEKQYVYFRGTQGLSTESAAEFMANHKSQAATVGAPGAADIPVSANPPR